MNAHDRAQHDIQQLSDEELELVCDEVLPEYKCYRLPRPALEALLVPMLVAASMPAEVPEVVVEVKLDPTPVVGFYERDQKLGMPYRFKHLA